MDYRSAFDRLNTHQAACRPAFITENQRNNIRTFLSSNARQLASLDDCLIKKAIVSRFGYCLPGDVHVERHEDRVKILIDGVTDKHHPDQGISGHMPFEISNAEFTDTVIGHKPTIPHNQQARQKVLSNRSQEVQVVFDGPPITRKENNVERSKSRDCIESALQAIQNEIVRKYRFIKLAADRNPAAGEIIFTPQDNCLKFLDKDGKITTKHVSEIGYMVKEGKEITLADLNKFVNAAENDMVSKGFIRLNDVKEAKLPKDVSRFIHLATKKNETKERIESWCLGGRTASPENRETIQFVYGKLYALFKEINTHEASLEYEVKERAMKALLLFGKFQQGAQGKQSAYFLSSADAWKETVRNLNKFIGTFAGNLPTPIHDIFQHPLPTLQNPGLWKQQICSKLGIEGIKALRDADQIAEPEKATQNLASLRRARMELAYQDAKNHPDLAELAMKYDVSSDQFNAMVELKGKLKLKQVDNLPNIKLVDKTNQLTFSKVPADSQLPQVLGNVTKCCQHTTGLSEQCVIDGMTRPNNGFYVLKNRDGEIAAQCYAWISKDGNMCLDSIEIHPRYHSNNSYLGAVKKMLEEFAANAIKNIPSISRVTIGKGGGTGSLAYSCTMQDAVCYETMKEGTLYGDANTQYLLARKSSFADLPLGIVNDAHAKLYRTVAADQSLQRKAELMDLIAQGAKISSYNDVRKLDSVDSDVFEVLSEFYASDLYANAMQKGIDPLELVHLPFMKFRQLLSDDVVYLCAKGHVPFDEFRNMPLEDIKRFTSSNAVRAYDFGFSFSDLKSFTAEQFDEFDFSKAEIALAAGLSIRDLTTLSNEKLSALVSESALTAYELGASIHDLKDLEIQDITRLTSKNSMQLYKDGVSVNDLKNLTPEKYRLLTSREAYGAYFLGVKFSELKDLEFSEIERKIRSEFE